MAAIVALEALKEHCEVILSTDSQYVRQGITQWIHNWKNVVGKQQTKTSKNVDLWQRLDAALGQHQIKLRNGLKAMPDTRKTNAVMNWLVLRQ